MIKTEKNQEKEKKAIEYLYNAIQKIQDVVQDLFDKQNRNQIDNLEFYFYCVGNDIYYNLHRYESIFNDELNLRDLWCKYYEELHDSVESICPILKKSGKIPSGEFDKINQEIYLFLLTCDELIAALLINNMIPVPNGCFNLVDIPNDRDKDYLNSEYIFLRKEKTKQQIINKAENVYKMVVEQKDEFLVGFCCDFKLLEEKCRLYK